MSNNPTGKGGFQAGQSGNPGGRPKVIAEVRALAQVHTAEGVEVLAQIMKNPKAPPAARVAAVKELFDRGYGRAESSVKAKIETSTASGPELDLTKLTDADWASLEALRPVLERARVKPPTEH